MFGILNINGIALDKQKLEEYIEKFASDNSVIKNSDIQTYPINDMLKNFEFITRVYNLLNEHVKLKINIHPAGEWLLDNYYIIEENVKRVIARPFCGSHEKMVKYLGSGFSIDVKSALSWLETEPDSIERNVLRYQINRYNNQLDLF